PRDPAGVRVDAAEAAAVQRIFSWYADEGLPLRAVARRLAAEGIPAASGQPRWNSSSVRKMLTNHAYHGTAYGNQREAVPARRRPARPSDPLPRPLDPHAAAGRGGLGRRLPRLDRSEHPGRERAAGPPGLAAGGRPARPLAGPRAARGRAAPPDRAAGRRLHR